MPLSAGSRLGVYQIVGLLGKGGMGEVYRARDTKLGRDVAIKVLPADFAQLAERVARFQREAQVLASLNHSNIAAIHDLQKHDSTEFLILELVEGETLAERIARGPIPVDETVEIGKQIAEALAAAHERGIIHRDLKPANIKITPAGVVKVLDFGLAKFYASDTPDTSLSQSPTVMSVRTGGNVILGTVAYMSPELARGRLVTKQTDIWALGCVLFEMLTQRLCYVGETVSDTIAKILKEEPDWSAVDSVAPAALRRVIERCLQKDPRRRFHDAADVRLELEEALVSTPPRPPEKRVSLWRTSFLVALFVAGIILGVAVMRWYPRADSPARSWAGTLLGGPSIAFSPRASPDGKMLAFMALINGQSQVGVMNPRSGNWTVLTHGEEGRPSNLNWSVDGTKIYFDHIVSGPAGVFSVPALGGETRLILEAACSPVPLPDGSLVVIRLNAERAAQLYRFKPETSDLQPLNAVVLSAYGAAVRAFPDGRELVFYGKPADRASAAEPNRLYILDLQSGQVRPIGQTFEANITSSGIGVLGLAVNPVDRSVLIDKTNGDLHQVVSIPYDGKGASRVLLTLTESMWGIDMTVDGSLFVDQVSRPIAIMRFKESDSATTPIAIIKKGSPTALELPERGILTTADFNGRSRLAIVKSNEELVPFVETEDESHEPLAFAGPNQVAFILGSAPKESIGLASIKDGRVLRRLDVPSSGGIKSLAASNDGTTLFFSSGGTIWSIPARGGNAAKLGAGDFVSYDHSRKDLVVYLNEAEGARLVRMPASGGSTQPIEQRPGTRVSNLVGPEAIRNDGQIVLPFTPSDSWFLGGAVLDPKTGIFRKVPLRYDADLFSLAWNQKNEIVAGGSLMRSSMWRFQLQDR